MAYNVYDSPYDPSTGGITAAIPYPGTVVEPMPPVTYTNPPPEGQPVEPTGGGIQPTRDPSTWAWQPDGTPYRDPNTGQCYVYQNGTPMKADDGACGGVMPHPGTETTPGGLGPVGTLPPGAPDPGDGPVGPFDPSGNPYLPVSYTPNTMPPIPGGTPSVDPYDIGSSPDVSGYMGLEGVSPVNPQADPFQYGEVSDFSDAAFAQAMRYLDPQFALEDRRHEQSLINKGLDPNSEAGIEALRRKEMGQSDLLSRAAFDALGFGTDLQNQMFGQAATRSGLSQELLQALMGLQQRGHEFDTAAGLNANQQAFAQMLALEGLDYRDYQTLIDQLRYDDSLALALLGLGGPPQYNTINTGFATAPAYDLQGALDMWNTPLFGGG